MKGDGRCAAGQAGFTMIEVLVALVVLSIGLLGVAKLVMTASRSDDSAYLRSQATALAYDILDAMRANRSAAINGDYNGTYTTVAAATSCYGAACAAGVLAASDLSGWETALQATLPPSWQGAIGTAADGSNTDVTVTVTWSDTAAQMILQQNLPGEQNQQVTLQSIL